MRQLPLLAGFLLIANMATPRTVTGQLRSDLDWPHFADSYEELVIAGEAVPGHRAIHTGVGTGDEETSRRHWWRNAGIGAAIGAAVGAGGTALFLEFFGPQVPYSPAAAIGSMAVYGAAAGALLGLIWTSGRT